MLTHMFAQRKLALDGHALNKVLSAAVAYRSRSYVRWGIGYQYS